MNCYSKEHWTTGLRVLKYLKKTSFGILHQGSGSVHQESFDADYAEDKKNSTVKNWSCSDDQRTLFDFKNRVGVLVEVRLLEMSSEDCVTVVVIV